MHSYTVQIIVLEKIFRNHQMKERLKSELFEFFQYYLDYRPILFEDVLTILVSFFLLLRDKGKGGESVRLA